MNSINFNTHQNHPLIEREQTYFLEKKHITIHSEDRDICKWPESNQFEITLPRDLLNVISMRLVDITIPQCGYTFSENNQNTKFRIEVSPQINSTDPDLVLEYNALEDYYNNFYYYEITIDEGFYTPEQLANEVQNKLNRDITTTLENNGYTLPSGYAYDDFVVKYNPSTHKLEFLNNRDNFTLLFTEKISYETSCGVKKVWCQTTNWGLPYYMGFEKKDYAGLINIGNYYIDSINFVLQTSTHKSSDHIYYAIPENVINLISDDVIYMELDKYNSIDEVEPYSHLTNNTYSNDYSGKTNGAFAKIPVSGDHFTKKFLSKNYELTNISSFKVPLQKVRKLKFKFRYHDGRMVDFKNQNFNFTIEACELIDEQARYKIINNVYLD
jgi:hypothetical protein